MPYNLLIIMIIESSPLWNSTYVRSILRTLLSFGSVW